MVSSSLPAIESSYLCFSQPGPRFLTLLAVPAARSHKLIHDRCLRLVFAGPTSRFTAAVTELSTPPGTRFLASTRGHHFPPQHAYHPPSVSSLVEQRRCPPEGQEDVCGEIAALLRFFDVDQAMTHFDPGRRDGEQNGAGGDRR
ncbi:hypothetical protein B0H14DRAFT_3473331 [Mycena olivaceomarginata]|nr:hypothetical protein B0H14DRAFT_3473331 [Mycena olivaceomarginata]